jgi:DeoR/GlpR family transcriptional regulator of sugar metabolism
VRRDLRVLVEAGLVQRFYGGLDACLNCAMGFQSS